MGHRLEVLEYLLCSDGLTKEGQGAKKLGASFFCPKIKSSQGFLFPLMCKILLSIPKL